ncbi:MAG: hypothetical protein K9I71_07480 [Ignavibacteriales bacterium]|nr:hypothetical protein [Ignavibacteriales bacterium]MCF8315949.1 hypothetical protein [Ignavibacteriales bacterium]MCF8437543.1 hypothetical protein [Ignavibacteriales bacterium]
MSEKKMVIKTVFDLEKVNTPFGKRWGGETITINENDLKQLQGGNLLALDVMSEYIVYIKLEK